MRTQKELGPKLFVLDQIIQDRQISLEELLTDLDNSPESFINSIYTVSYDEMTREEQEYSINWIKQVINACVKQG